MGRTPNKPKSKLGEMMNKLIPTRLDFCKEYGLPHNAIENIIRTPIKTSKTILNIIGTIKSFEKYIEDRKLLIEEIKKEAKNVIGFDI